MLTEKSIVSLAAERQPQLIVVVDTEEEFDWSLPPDSSSNSITAIREIGRVQEIFDEYGIVPCYVIDYPIASQKEGIDNLKPVFESSRCEIGAHLHPWVNPPCRETLNWQNTYPGNLGADLEFEKLDNLTATIHQNFGVKPEIYKAGRYGIGNNTAGILKRLGYRIDLSVCSAFDYRADGGPDFSDCSADTYWIGEDGELLEIPLSCAFVGNAGPLSKHLYRISGHFSILKARGILSRLGIVDRLMLSPEGYVTSEHIKLTRFLLDKGVRIFTWNFHSPTVVPGMTMYTQSAREVSRFLDSFRRYFDFFLGELQGKASTPTQIISQLEAVR